MNLDDLKAYKLVKKENLSDIRSTGYLLRHIKTGARVMVIENDDENKVFNIAFRTPPKNSTGIFRSFASFAKNSASFSSFLFLFHEVP